jgi:hypothetical protein
MYSPNAIKMSLCLCQILHGVFVILKKVERTRWTGKIASAFFEQNRDMVKGKTQRVPVDHLIPRLHMATMDVGLTGV